MSFLDSKAEIHYPCPWQFTVIGRGENAITAAVGEVMGDRKYRLIFSKNSGSGKYQSYALSTEVESEADRDCLFQGLLNTEPIKVVL